MLKRWDRIQQRMHLTDNELERLQHELKRLNPRPGSALDETVGVNIHQITPDFIVDTDSYGQITLSLNNGNIPPLRVSNDDIEFVKSYAGRKNSELSRSEREGLTYIRAKVDKAQLFVDAIRQRRSNMLATMKAIIDMQKPFFETGDETLLQPMRLEDIASRTGLDKSTISRVSNSKWVQTTFGIHPLRWFFTSKAKLDGDDVSVRSIKTALQEIIAEEDKQAPFSDETLAEKLKQKGYEIARRTIAKYREQMGIPVARLRK